MNSYKNRMFVLLAIFMVIGLTFVFRLLFIQVLSDKWLLHAEEISISRKVEHPNRGLIFDRNGELLVSAIPVYDIYVTPKMIGQIDTASLCDLLGISRVLFDKKIEVARSWPNVSYKASRFIKGLSPNDFADISVRLGQFSGFEAHKRTERDYPRKVAAHALGYVREISKPQLEKDTSEYYRPGDFIGVSGIEQSYENELRGIRGSKKFLRDFIGNEKSSLELKTATPGNNLISTIDINLQEYGEKLMYNKLGSIVAIEPESGEILAIVSAPTYDPSLFVGRKFAQSWKDLTRNDSLKPLINRPIYNDQYRPGSIFKLVQALVALEMGVITPQTGFICNRVIGCHNHAYPFSVAAAIQHSCNPYFYFVYRRIIQRNGSSNVFRASRSGLTNWVGLVKTFGLGKRLQTDIPGVKTGRIPDTTFYDKWYGQNRWAFSTIYSNSIGEGEIGVAPIQMANLAAIIANRGWYYMPHLIKKVGETGNKKREFLTRHYTAVSAQHFDPIIHGMELVVQAGTGRSAQVDSISICGKTGTVQNDNFNDHSVFIAFAPKDKPKIAIAVYVEYGTWGGTWAAPIASLMIEKYLRNSLSARGKVKEKRVLDTPILTKDASF